MKLRRIHIGAVLWKWHVNRAGRVVLFNTVSGLRHESRTLKTRDDYDGSHLRISPSVIFDYIIKTFPAPGVRLLPQEEPVLFFRYAARQTGKSSMLSCPLCDAGVPLVRK